MKKTLSLTQRISVVRYDAYAYSPEYINSLTDTQVLELAAGDKMNFIVHDSLDEYQKDFNNNELDWNDCCIRFCVRPFAPASKKQMKKHADQLLQSYHNDDICMGEFLAAEPADGMSIEQAHHTYVVLMNRAEKDLFFVQKEDGPVEQISVDF